MKLNLNYKYLLLAYLGAVLLLTVLPINSANSPLNDTYFVQIRLDYVLHFILYLPLVYVLDRGAQLPFKVTVGIALAIAVGMEWLQYLLPYRAFNINDMLANAVGCGLSLAVVLLLRRRYLKR